MKIYKTTTYAVDIGQQTKVVVQFIGAKVVMIFLGKSITDYIPPDHPISNKLIRSLIEKHFKQWITRQ